MSPESIYLLPYETLPPQRNMEIDRHLLFGVEEGSSPPSLRLYGWDRLSVSVGAHQKGVPELSVPVVRRPTGGGALLHGWDLSFALVDHRHLWGGSPKEIYKRVARVMAEAFSSLGVRLSMSSFDGRYSDSWLCFTYPTFGELTSGGRKVIAMAMKTLKRAFLIHGSVYITFDTERASKVLGVEEGILKKRILSLSEMGIEARDVKERLTQAFLRKREELLLTRE